MAPSPYHALLAQPVNDSQKRAVVGPLPRITELYDRLSDVTPSEQLTDGPGDLLHLEVEESALVLPSLDASPFLQRLGMKTFENITILVGINSDTYNRGLGVMLKASAKSGSDLPEEQRGHWYEYGGGRSINKFSNKIQFHPGMRGGQLRVEGQGGFGNMDIGFDPPSWTTANHQLNMLEITLGIDGANQILIRSAAGDEMWSKSFNNLLFDGRHIPEMHGWIDLGGTRGQPLVVGPISLRVETATSIAQALLQEYVVAMGKAIAGSLRLLLEDALQAACQSVFLIKKWKKLTLFSKAFTLFSIFAGVFLSMLGPLKEFHTASKVRAKAAESGGSGELSMDMPEAQEDSEEKSKGESKDAIHVAETDRAVKPDGKDTSPANNDLVNVTQLYNMSIVDFVSQRGRGKKHVNARTAHRALLVSSIAFWLMMAALPFAIKDQVTCDGNPPTAAIYCFFASSLLDILIQIWVLVQTRQGFLMLVLDTRRFFFGAGLSFLGRFDTFSDVLSTIKLYQCEEITWFSIKGHYFYLPSLGGYRVNLFQISLFTLIVGVLFAQALPGLILLARKQYLAIAFKLNEFTLLLTVMEHENDEFGNATMEVSSASAATGVAAGVAVVAVAAVGGESVPLLHNSMNNLV